MCVCVWIVCAYPPHLFVGWRVLFSVVVGNYRCIVKTPVKDTTFWLYPAEIKKLATKYVIKAIEARFPGTSELVAVEDIVRELCVFSFLCG
jgi:hypothetical protein